MKEMNATFAIHKETKHVETTGKKLNLKKKFGKFVRGSFLKLRRGSSEKI